MRSSTFEASDAGKMNRKYVVLLISLATVGLLAPASALAERVWSITPYLWATDTTYELVADGTPVDAGEIDFGDLYDTLDASFQVVVETGTSDGRWSIFADFTYLETSDDETLDIPDDIPGIDTLRVDSESEQIYLDAAIAFWPWGEEGGFNVYGGLRYIDLDDVTTFDVTEPTPARLGKLRLDREFYDALLGARHRFDFSDRWSLLVQADYGFGDSEGVFMTQGLLRYAVGKAQRHGVMLGYRYKEAGFDDSGLEEDYEYKGALMGFNFRF